MYNTINVRENRKGNQEWTIQIHRQQWTQDTEQRQIKQKTQRRKQTRFSFLAQLHTISEYCRNLTTSRHPRFIQID
jgi:hypothetical protein